MTTTPRAPRHARRGSFLAAFGVAATLAGVLAAVPAAADTAAAAAAPAPFRSPPNVLLISIDTLRADHLSGYGYERPTSPAIDRLLAGGARFTEARTVEPLTSPASCSMLTALYPHEHGSTRNGVSLRSGLPSLPKELDRSGYQTAAFIANWTLENKMSGLGEHFQHFGEILTRKRWLGLVAGEATAEDVNEAAVAWLDEHAGRRRPFFLWVHYVEPHAPYEFQGEVAARLGLRDRSEATRIDRYDTEIAFVDHYVGKLVQRIEEDPALDGNTLIVFTSDHGESLGEHGYWGHGKRLFEPGLRIPLAVYWPGRVEAQTVEAPASILDVAPTVLGLLGEPTPATFHGFDWTPVLTAGAVPPAHRSFGFQAHKGAVVDGDETARSRSKGLIAVAWLQDGKKEILHFGRHEHKLYDLATDPRERKNLTRAAKPASEETQAWRKEVEDGLARTAGEPLPHLDEEAIEKLKSLGYLDG